jgi:hypothetical protein
MRKWLTLLAIAASTTLHAESRWHLQSNVWVNLHQRLMYETRFGPTPPPAALSGDDLAKWKTAVDAYRTYLGKKHPLIAKELIDLNAALSATKGAKLPDSIPPAAAAVLDAAMPLYRAGQWEEDDRANRFWISLAEPMLASAGEELVQAHEKAYGRPFPKRVLVDVTSFGWEFGAYTVGNEELAHSVIQSIDNPGGEGFYALESLLHEPSHVIVGDTSGAIGEDLARLTKELGIRPYANLWHAILFYTSGELTRRALARRGVHDYQPIITLMYDRGFKGFRQALETHWQAYLDGKVSREAAIRQIFIETAPPPKK